MAEIRACTCEYIRLAFVRGSQGIPDYFSFISAQNQP